MGEEMNNFKDKDAWRRKLSISKIGKKNPMWEGSNVGYASLHEYIRNRMVLPKKCKFCSSTNNIDLANKSGNYLRKTSDWQWLCRSCHMKADGRLSRFMAIPKRLPQEPLPCSNCQKPSKPLRKKLCHACNEYKRRHGMDRPPSLYENTRN